MKKAFLFGMICVYAMSANAQLGKPTTSVKDTFYISEVYYNGTKLNRADWPDTMIVEDALNVYIAKYIYVKGKLKKKWGGENYYDATCKGKTSSITIERNRKYTIDDYVFFVRRVEKSYSLPEVNPNVLFNGRKNIRDDKIDNLEENEQSHGAEGVSPELKVGSGHSLCSLAGRSAVSLPTPHYNSNIQGKIVVKIWVNRNGDVVKAECPVKGSTITDAKLVTIAKASALKAKFSADENAPEEQIGTITYIIKI